MKKRIAEKIVNGRILPAAAPDVAKGDGWCYSDRERKAARIFVRRGGKVAAAYRRPEFCLHPGTVHAADGDIHFIGPMALAHLYQLNRGEYTVRPSDEPLGRPCDGFRCLYPSASGSYGRPAA